MVSALPERPDLDQLRRRAKERVKAGAAPTLAGAQLTLAREYGLPSWPRLVLEVRRKRLIHAADADGLRALVTEHPDLARSAVSSTLSGPDDSTLDYVAVARFHGALDRDAAGELTRVLLAAGADTAAGHDGPLVAAASYGELDMVRALLAAGADVHARGTAVPGGGSALAHAVHYGMPQIVDLLVAAGARVDGVVEHAGVGDVPPSLLAAATPDELGRALRAAAVCGRATAIDQLLADGAAIDGWVDGGTALHWAAWQSAAPGIEALLTRGADATLRDPRHDLTAAQWYRFRRAQLVGVGHPDARRDAARIEKLLPDHA